LVLFFSLHVSYLDYFCPPLSTSRGTRWRRWLGHSITSREGSIPNEVIELIYWLNPSDRTLALGSTQPNEYQGYLLVWGKGGRFVGLITLPPSCTDCLEILRASTSSSPKGLYGPGMGQVYLYLKHLQTNGEMVPKLQTGNKYRPSQFTLITTKHIDLPVPVAAQSTAYVCGRSPVEVMGSNPTGGMVVSCECCV
jgi:hypothetical protein